MFQDFDDYIETFKIRIINLTDELNKEKQIRDSLQNELLKLKKEDKN
jgi:hypothetical protein